MSSKKQTCSRRASGKGRSARKGKKSDQLFSNDDFGNTKVECDTPKNEPASKQNKPASNQNEPASKQNEPVSKQNKPASKQNKPASKQNKPASKQNKPASKQNEPTPKQNASTSQQNEPTSSQIDPTPKQNASTSQQNASTSQQNASTSKQNEPTPTFWFMVRLFLIQANEADLKWLDNLMTEYDIKHYGGTSQVTDNTVTEDKKDGFMVKQLLNIKQTMHYSSIVPATSNNLSHYHNAMGTNYVLADSKGEQIVVSRKTLEYYLNNNDFEPIMACPSSDTQIKTINYEFIERLIDWDESLSHLRGLPTKTINDYLNKCREENILERTINKMEIMDKKILSSKRRGNYSIKKERKNALLYQELEDIRLIVEKFNAFAVEKYHPYFMNH